MHSEAEAMLEHLQIAKAKFKKQQQESSVSMSLQPLHEREKSMRYDHLCTRMENGKYYSLNRSDGSSLAFQVICKHPERRAYVQRICLLGKDVSQLEQIMYIFLPVLYCIVLYCTYCFEDSPISPSGELVTGHTAQSRNGLAALQSMCVLLLQSH